MQSTLQEVFDNSTPSRTTTCRPLQFLSFHAGLLGPVGLPGLLRTLCENVHYVVVTDLEKTLSKVLPTRMCHCGSGLPT